ncbi:conserved hypothetical protein [Talaromyces stipitatus ATCC 10500]|uniref:Uncharacterized protein n=1 Tax=Talaromyces stipitatus (strain ATCC 10500 / CBS 375.48 / QM 6759 / NRRL 1006) TaxID=441959 RepID=B8MTW4_TALSN|nr:uncharacterized protein TSTA_006080 [Talaromyces stipitatus ATCC 10500]EED12578.1 conserved hypothetical protein [Talaromyces stipitatus ATCC 10500]
MRRSSGQTKDAVLAPVARGGRHVPLILPRSACLFLYTHSPRRIPHRIYVSSSTGSKVNMALVARFDRACTLGDGDDAAFWEAGDLSIDILEGIIYQLVMFANTAHKSWRDHHSGKSSPDSYRYSSSLSSQVALDTPSSEPATPVEVPLLVLPKRRGHQHSGKSSVKSAHIRKPSRDERSSTSIDLSRSSIELEGLGIYTNLERDTRFQQNRHSVSNLHRSISEISPSPSIRLGQTYVHPRRQLPTPSSPLGIPQRHSVDGGYFSTINRSMTGFTSPTLSIPDDEHEDNDSNSFDEADTPKTTSLELRRSTPIILQRAQTDTALSRASSWKESEFLSSTELTSHAAAVRAARIAFAEKEASKARKLEEQQKKKTQQRDERRHQRSVSHMVKYIDLEEDMAPDQVTSVPPLPGKPITPSSALGPPKLPAATKHNWNKFLTWGKTRYYKAKRKVSMPVPTFR